MAWRKAERGPQGPACRAKALCGWGKQAPGIGTILLTGSLRLSKILSGGCMIRFAAGDEILAKITAY